MQHEQFLSRFDLYDYDYKMYQTYLDGLNWCSNMYSGGSYEYQIYMYTSEKSPHPFGLLFHLEHASSDCVKTILQEEKLEINEDVYAALILPKAYLNLLDDNIKLKVNQQHQRLSFLYEEELCDDCTKLHTSLSNLYKLDTYAENTKKEMAKLLKQLIDHKQRHKDIDIEQIKYVIETLK